MEPVKQRQRSPPRPKVAAVAAPEPTPLPEAPATTKAAQVETEVTTSPVETVQVEQCKTVAFLRIQKLLDLDD